MKPQAADGAALVAAAVQAAIQAGAPRRTVAAVAAAVAGTSLSAAARPTPSATRAREPPLDPQSAAEETGDPAQLLASLRASRRAQRLRKKQRRREAKTSTAVPLIADSAAASPGNTDTKNCEQHHHGGDRGDMPCAAARGSQDAEASTAAVQLIQIASEAPELIMAADGIVEKTLRVLTHKVGGSQNDVCAAFKHRWKLDPAQALEQEVPIVLRGMALEQTSMRQVFEELERRLGLEPRGLDGNKDLCKQLVAAEIAKIQAERDNT